MTFEPNAGQTDPAVRYLARTSTGVVFVQDSSLLFHRQGSKPVRLDFGAAARGKSWIPSESTGHVTNYRIGRDASKWIDGLPSYRRLSRQEIQPGMNLVLYGNSRNELEYDFIVAPGADPSSIRIRTNADVKIEPASGALVVGGIRQRRPVVTQDSREIAGRFKLLGKREIGFALASYDRSKPLVIDPVIESREYFGGTGSDTITSINRRGWLVGTTTSIDLPGSVMKRHGTDVFATRDGVTFVMGGTGNEIAANCEDRFSSDQSVFVAGTTDSRDLPVTQFTSRSTFFEYNGGASDGFVWFIPARPQIFQPAQLVAYIGTGGEDRILAATINGPYFAVVGSTDGGPFVASSRFAPFQPNRGGGVDGFVANGVVSYSSSSSLVELYGVYYMGGSGEDRIHSITDYGGNYFVAGETASVDFPLRDSSYQAQRRGSTDAFIANITTDNFLELRLASVSLFGGGGFDRIHALTTILGGSRVTAVGTTSSTDLPVSGAFQATYGGGPSDAFQVTFQGDLTAILQSTFIGGSSTDEGLAATSDSFGALYAAGRTASRNLPVRDASQGTFGGGGTDGFIVKSTQEGSLTYSTYFGGSAEDEVVAMASDFTFSRLTLRIAGSTTSVDLPGPSAFNFVEPGRAGSTDGFTAEISSSGIDLPASISGAKGFVSRTVFAIGDWQKLATANRATIRSDDPSIALVSFSESRVPLAEDTALSGSGFAPFTMAVSCQVATGSTKITLEIPGYESAAMQVYCVQPELEFEFIGPEVTTNPWQTRVLALTALTRDPATGLKSRVQAPAYPNSAEPTMVTFTSSDPSTAFTAVRNAFSQFEPATVIALFSDTVYLRAARVGDAVITASAPGFLSASIRIRSVAPFDASKVVETAAGYSAFDRIALNGADGFGRLFTVRSLDPRVALVSRLNGTGEPSLDGIDAGFGYEVHGAPGAPIGAETVLEISSPELPAPIRRTVRIVPLAVRTQFSELPLRLTLQAQRSLAFNSLRVSPGQPPVSLTVENSNPAAVLAPSTIPIGVFGVTTITGISLGSSTIVLKAPPGVLLQDAAAEPIPVQVVTGSLSARDLDLGQDLVVSQEIRLDRFVSAAATVSTSTPSLLQLQADVLSPVASSIQVSRTPQGNGDFLRFRVIGLAAEGEGRVTVSVSGYDPVTFTVRLRPRGLVWDRDQYNVAVGGTVSAIYRSAAIDPVTGFPIQIQDLRSGFVGTPGSLTIENSNPAVAAITGFSVSGLTSGETYLTLRQSGPSLLAPSIRQRVRVVVDSATPK